MTDKFVQRGLTRESPSPWQILQFSFLWAHGRDRTSMCRDGTCFDQWNVSGSLTYSKQLLVQPSSPSNSWTEFPPYGMATGDIPDYGGWPCQPPPRVRRCGTRPNQLVVHIRAWMRKGLLLLKITITLGGCFHSVTSINSSQKLLHIRIIWRTF